MKTYLFTIAFFLMAGFSMSQEKTISTERSLQIDPTATSQADTVRTETRTERTLKKKNDPRKKEKEVKVFNERAVRNEE